MHGTVIASCRRQIQILSDRSTIQPTNSKAHQGANYLGKSRESVADSTRGSINVSMGEEMKTIEAGSSYRMAVARTRRTAGSKFHGGPKPPDMLGDDRRIR